MKLHKIQNKVNELKMKAKLEKMNEWMNWKKERKNCNKKLVKYKQFKI